MAAMDAFTIVLFDTRHTSGSVEQAFKQSEGVRLASGWIIAVKGGACRW